MDIVCFNCHKIVCEGLPDDTVFNGTASCLDCSNEQVEMEDEIRVSRCMGKKIKQLIANFEFYENIKTGKVYNILNVATDATNGNEGALYMVYRSIEDDPEQLYVREYDEFNEKFIKTEGV